MNNKTTFWNYIKNNVIEIPIIQRDYAQGRLGKENLRKNFLTDLKKALDNEGAYKNTVMKLDFVYGSTENNKRNPLDGQQRLTTLWLLHWYIALRAGKLNDASNHLKNFSYETRISSRNFCEEMCKPENFENFNLKSTIVEYITNQTWFYSAWKQDPTIQSMLRMLGGTKIADKKGEDIVDGIEEIFQNTNEDEFNGYWQMLTEKEIIVFYHLPLSDFGLSDDLYIKMNARGKQLTSFENFKADLIGYITKQSENETLDENEQSEWEKLLDPENGIPIKLDTDWTDVFWKNRSNDNRIDEIYFAFINRFFLQELICAKKEDNTNYLYSVNDLEEKNGTFNYLYGNKSDDSQLLYSGLERYFYQEKLIPHSLFKNLSNTLSNYKPENLIYFPEWVDSKFEFIPKYNDAGQISTLGQKERVVFLAVCKYFEEGEYESRSFMRWMRVVWNIVENSGIETVSSMIGVMRLIDELSIHSHDIYILLSNDSSEIKSDVAKSQIAEERVKAKQILKDENIWEPLLLKAENHKYLKGKAAALFEVDKTGSFLLYNNEESFRDRYELFENISSEDNEDKYHFIKILLSYCDKDKPWANLNLSEFKSCLNDATIINSFRGISRNEINPEVKHQWIKQLVNTNVLNNSRGKYLRKDKPYLFATEGRTWNAYGNIVLDDMHCNNNVLSMLVSIEPYYKIKDCDCFWGWDINFKFEGHFFRWTGDNEFYLMEDNWINYQICPKERIQDEDKFYHFKVESMKDPEEFASNLKKLIVQASSDRECREYMLEQLSR